MDDQPPSPVRRPPLPRLPADGSSLRGVRKAQTSNIYTSAASAPHTPTSSPLRRGLPGTISSGSGFPASPAAALAAAAIAGASPAARSSRPMSYSSDHSSQRKSALSPSSRHSDGSGSISIRYSIAPRTAGAYRSFSVASDLLPGSGTRGSLTNDANSDVVDSDEEVASVPVDEQDRSVFDAVTAVEGGAHHAQGLDELTQRNFLGVPGFYYNRFDSNYDSSEEDPEDDSSMSISYDGDHPSLPSSPMNATALPGENGIVPQADSLASSDEDSSIEFAEQSYDMDAQYTPYVYADDEADAQVQERPWTANAAIPPSSPVQQQQSPLRRIIHPAASSNFEYVFRVRDVVPSDPGSPGQQRGLRTSRSADEILVPVFNEGLSFSTFPYMNSMTPLAAVVRRQPQSHYATTVVMQQQDVRRDSHASTVLPPLPNAGQRHARSDDIEEEKTPPTQIPLDEEKAVGGNSGEELDVGAALELLSRMERRSKGLRHEEMFEHHEGSHSGHDRGAMSALGGPPPTLRRRRVACRPEVARVLLAAFICFPPMWIVMGAGGLDGVIGEVPHAEVLAARVLGGATFVGAVVGMGVGLGVGL
ncbi:uncharacterized protein V1518DRAFT_412620 [Limtongia smithiae]|uniref:uncharacterized protein n=1 Tax=Limtongia smithiae TaxID=1125753 RepID=UPI0034CDA580